MNKKKVLKILALIVGPILPMMIAIYFLFPYLNESKYDSVAEKYDDTTILGDGSFSDTSTSVESIGEDFATLKERSRVFQQNINELNHQIDSIKAVNDSLQKKLTAKEQMIANIEEKGVRIDTVFKYEEPRATDSLQEEISKPISQEEFAENVKSLLGLDEDVLAPIVNQLSDNQLIRLYRNGSSREQKKLLRTLESKRAAKLMTEVM